MLDEPALVRRVILAGTGLPVGASIDKVGAVSRPLILKGLLTFRDPKTYLFFTSSAHDRSRQGDQAESNLGAADVMLSSAQVVRLDTASTIANNNRMASQRSPDFLGRRRSCEAVTSDMDDRYWQFCAGNPVRQESPN